MMFKFLIIMLLVLSSQTKAELSGNALLGVQSYFERDFDTAVKHLHGAALKGNPEAQYLLGHMFEHGEGVEVNQKASFEWYLAAAERGTPPAQYNLSLNYSFGIGTKKDEAKGLYWLQEAAEQGHDYAKFKLGLDLIEKANAATERKRGLMWLRLASLANVADAQQTYALLAPSYSISEHSLILQAAHECIEKAFRNCSP